MKPLTDTAPAARLRRCATLIAEMAEAYGELAEQMESCNNAEAAAMFHQLARRQHYHLERLGLPRSADSDLAAGAPSTSPVTLLYGGAHYLMTPYHVIELALETEQQIRPLAPDPAERPADEALRRFMEERRRHLDSLRQLLHNLPRPDAHWDEDPDPPHLDQ